MRHLHLSFVDLRAEPDHVPIGVDVRSLAVPVGHQFDEVGATADARPRPLGVEGICVAHVEAGGAGEDYREVET